METISIGLKESSTFSIKRILFETCNTKYGVVAIIGLKIKLFKEINIKRGLKIFELKKDIISAVNSCQLIKRLITLNRIQNSNLLFNFKRSRESSNLSG